MRRIDFTQPSDRAWKDWRRRCEKARNKIIDAYKAGKDIKINEDLYKEMKVDVYMHYDQPFRGKCAYCDRDIYNQHGDVEHFRPKGGVTDASDVPVTRIIRGVKESHPGYYWLVYDLSNLLPACIRCNQISGKFTSGKLIGKWNRFPVKGFRAWKPGDEKREEPLLINPMFVDPTDHLIFDKSGVLGWKTRQGKETIDILGLNEYDLPDRRKERYESVKSVTSEYINLYRANSQGDQTGAFLKRIKKIKSGYGEFTTYALMGIEDSLDDFQKAISAINN